VDSPCIDAGTDHTFPGFRLLTQFDMDGEARSSRLGSTNAPGAPDIGADEFAYRIAFPLDAAGHSQVDEASGVAYLGTNSTGPLIAVVDDELRTNCFIYQLDATATRVLTNYPIAVTNAAYANTNDQELADLEGLTFDASGNRLYLLTSQTRRNRYRDVDHLASDPANDPPSNDYDRRRTAWVRLRLDATLTRATNWAHFESESNGVPANVGYDPLNGLAAFIRDRLTNNPALGATNRGNRVLLAHNTVNKFGTPVNGTAYTPGMALPYTHGGPASTAGVSILYHDPGT
jgi:hypothetical protein